MVYETKSDKVRNVEYKKMEVYYWEQSDKDIERASVEPTKEQVHSWRPPCSCGVSLDDVLD
jgi:hypothetical protein